MYYVYIKYPDTGWMLYHKYETETEAMETGRDLTDLDYEVQIDQDIKETANVSVN